MARGSLLLQQTIDSQEDPWQPEETDQTNLLAVPILCERCLAEGSNLEDDGLPNPAEYNCWHCSKFICLGHAKWWETAKEGV